MKTAIYIDFEQGAIKHGQENRDSAPDLCVMRVPPPPRIHALINVNESGKFMQKELKN
jgi:hypothetical protein